MDFVRVAILPAGFDALLYGAAMEIDVRVFATLRRYLPDLAIGEALHMTGSEGDSLADICDQLGIPRSEVKITLQNSVKVELDALAHEGDRIAFFPAVGGG
jgi:molybdopterin converting factor small subunit